MLKLPGILILILRLRSHKKKKKIKASQNHICSATSQIYSVQNLIIHNRSIFLLQIPYYSHKLNLFQVKVKNSSYNMDTMHCQTEDGHSNSSSSLFTNVFFTVLKWAQTCHELLAAIPRPHLTPCSLSSLSQPPSPYNLVIPIFPTISTLQNCSRTAL